MSPWSGSAYRSYLRRRGFAAPDGWTFVRRGFLEPWFQAGFHRFWRLWNPGLGFLTHALFRALGGARHAIPAKIATFALSGLAHGIIVLALLGWSWTVPSTFMLFGLVSVASERLQPLLRQRRWPRLINLALNIALVLGCFDMGFRIDERYKRCGRDESGGGRSALAPLVIGVRDR
ncbi:MAG: hypothetical protein PVF68_16240 [Acidobacteriota bacterium]|jgi:hypothetical protein